MAEIINLRQARKAMARAIHDSQAAESRTRFGRTKDEKRRDKTAAENSAKFIDGHRREPTDKDERS